MREHLSGGPLSLIAVIVILVLAALFIPGAGKIAFVLTVLLTLFLIVVLAIGVWAVLDGKKQAEMRRALRAQGRLDELEGNRKELSEIRLTLMSMDDKEISGKGMEIYNQAGTILDTIRKQPEEIPRTVQFRRYYLPALVRVFKQYRSLEQSNTLREGDKEKLMAFLEDTRKAFDSQYQALFNDEQFNMDVEIKTARMIFEREGHLKEEES